MKIAIIGTGISGLGAAYILHGRHEITVYERDARTGGHSRTIDIPGEDGPVAVDTGFIVFNRRNYPQLCGLFAHLEVPVSDSDMSFGTSIAGGWLEYGSKGLFAQRRNLARPAYWRMLADVLRFNREAARYLDADPAISLGRCLDELRMGEWFRRYYLQAMGAAIWSCSVESILDFPAAPFLRFFHNHGLLTVNGHPQWYTVRGGSREYLSRLCAPFADRIRRSCAAVRVSRRAGGVSIKDSSGREEDYDAAVLACHADEALSLLDRPDGLEQELLGSFRFQPNQAVVHGDTSFLPRRRGCWASWVYLCEAREDRAESVSLSYWMNNLQPLPTRRPVIVTLNPGREPDPALVYDRHDFSHPMFDLRALRAQGRLQELQGRNHCWYCGAWQRHGFHEDGLRSAVEMAETMGVQAPWKPIIAS